MTIAEPDRTPRRQRRKSLIISYSLAVGSGVCAIVSGLQGPIGSFLGWTTFAFAAGLAAGGAAAAVGAWRVKWTGELLGLPVTFATFGLIGFVLCIIGAVQGRLTPVSLGLAFGGYAALLFARHQTVRGFARRERDHAATTREGGDRG